VPFYFGGAFPHDERFAQLYAADLRTVEEPSLSCGQEIVEAYRLLDVPPYGAPRVVIRASRRSDARGADVVVIVLQGDGHVADRKERSVSDSEWLVLQSAVQAFDAWHVPPVLIDTSRPALTEGAGSVFEARVDNLYHATAAGSVRKDEFDRLARVMFSLAGRARQRP
jgi:hypothetical protein